MLYTNQTNHKEFGTEGATAVISTHAPTNYHILVIDNDEPQQSESLSSVLQGYGYHISHLYNPQQALSDLRETPSTTYPDLIICDLLGDGMDGLEFLRNMRTPSLFGTPIMIVTSLESNSTFEKAVIDLGADDFVIKPVRTSELLLRVRLLLRGLPGVSAWKGPELL